MKLRRFNDQGVARFGQFLAKVREEPASGMPPGLLVDEACSAEVPSGPEIAAEHFATRMDAARCLDLMLADVDSFDILRDVGLWAWLSLFFFDSLCPPDSSGRRNVGDNARYIPAVTNYRKYYRHLLAGPYGVFRAHRDAPERAMVLLCGPLHKPGDIAEQMASRQEIVTNPGIVGLATQIYFDPLKGSFKRGSANKGNQPGTVRRLIDVLNQFDLTWDLYWMPSERIMAKLPKEFDKFRPAPAT